MHYKISFAVFLYAAAALIDAILGFSIASQIESYIFRAASAIAIIAIYMQLTGKNKPYRPLPFIIASLIISIAAITLGQTGPVVLINTALKVAAIVLTLKPEVIEVEIITEEEEAIPAQEN